MMCLFAGGATWRRDCSSSNSKFDDQSRAMGVHLTRTRITPFYNRSFYHKHGGVAHRSGVLALTWSVDSPWRRGVEGTVAGSSVCGYRTTVPVQTAGFSRGRRGSPLNIGFGLLAAAH